MPFFYYIWQVLFYLRERVTGKVGNFQFSGEKEDTRPDHYMREIAGCQGHVFRHVKCY
jgi:hypothetical protein